jgi:hypothetical protein
MHYKEKKIEKKLVKKFNIIKFGQKTERATTRLYTHK